MCQKDKKEDQKVAKAVLKRRNSNQYCDKLEVPIYKNGDLAKKNVTTFTSGKGGRPQRDSFNII